MTVTEASKILGIARKTVIAWIDSGELEAEKVPGSGAKGFKYEVSRESVLRKGKEKLDQSETKEAKSTKKEGSAEVDEGPPPETLKYVELIKSLDLSDIEAERLKGTLSFLKKNEAEVIFKLEQALGKMRENLFSKEHYVPVNEYRESIEAYFASFFSGLQEVVEVWKLRYQLPGKQAQEMLRDINQVVKASAQALSEMAK